MAEVFLNRRSQAGLWLLVGLTIAGRVVIDEMQAVYPPGPVELRSWIALYNATLLALHCALLGLLIWGLNGMRRTKDSVLLHLALVSIVLSATAAVAMIGLPLVFGRGPWHASSWQVRTLTHLTFAPSVLRDFGIALTSVLLMRFGHQRRLAAVAFALFALSLTTSIYVWVQTPREIIARLHSSHAAIAVGQWTAAMVLLACIGRRNHATTPTDLEPDKQPLEVV